MSSEQYPSVGYPAVTPMTLEGILKVYLSEVVTPISSEEKKLSPHFYSEEAFWAGAESVMSIMTRAKVSGASVEEGGQVIARIFLEIRAANLAQPARVRKALDA